MGYVGTGRAGGSIDVGGRRLPSNRETKIRGRILHPSYLIFPSSLLHNTASINSLSRLSNDVLPKTSLFNFKLKHGHSTDLRVQSFELLLLLINMYSTPNHIPQGNPISSPNHPSLNRCFSNYANITTYSIYKTLLVLRRSVRPTTLSFWNNINIMYARSILLHHAVIVCLAGGGARVSKFFNDWSIVRTFPGCLRLGVIFVVVERYMDMFRTTSTGKIHRWDDHVQPI